MKLAVVVQRYGPAINGGAELHARYIAEHLARHAEVEVLTTCATDYVTWRNELPAGEERVNGVLVRRFRVRHERNTNTFGRRSARVFDETHSLGDELDWLDAEGPTSPALVDYVAKHAADYDFCLFFSYRYYHAYYGARAAGARAILVPTAERDATIGLSIFQPLFRSVRALMYNSPEERAMIQAVSGNQSVPGVVVGIGSDVPNNPQAARFRQKYNIRGPFAVYVGRIDQNKGCKELFEFFQGYVRDVSSKLTLVLIGHSLLPIPEHPRIRHLGFLDDADKFDAMAAADCCSCRPTSRACRWWRSKRGRSAGRCWPTASATCSRASASAATRASTTRTTASSSETLRAIEQNRWLTGTLGRNGRQFFREHYDWPVIERKYLDMFTRLTKGRGAHAHGTAARLVRPPAAGSAGGRRREAAGGPAGTAR